MARVKAMHVHVTLLLHSVHAMPKLLHVSVPSVPRYPVSLSPPVPPWTPCYLVQCFLHPSISAMQPGLDLHKKEPLLTPCTLV